MKSRTWTAAVAAAGGETLNTVPCPCLVVGVGRWFGLASTSGHTAATDTGKEKEGGGACIHPLHTQVQIHKWPGTHDHTNVFSTAHTSTNVCTSKCVWVFRTCMHAEK